MDRKLVFELAIEALQDQADNSYEGEELDDPQVQAWIQQRHDAIAEIEKYRKKLSLMGLL